MNVSILLFGPAADAVGAASVRVDLPDGATTASLAPAIRAQVPALAPFVDQGRFAVNARYGPNEQPIQADDEIALIVMVSGG